MVSECPSPRPIVIESDISAAQRICRKLLDVAAGGGFNDDELFGIHLALEEAFVNALKHGNKMDPKKHVTIDYLVTEEKFEVSIADDGPGFVPAEVPDPRRSENLCKAFGRGLLLMKSFMDVVEHNKAGNCVRMVKYRAGAKNKN